MPFLTLAAVYVLVWVLVFFMVLPMGIQSHHDTGGTAERGHDPGAPVSPRLIVKGLQTSFIALVISALLYLFVAYGYFDRIIYWLMPL